MGYLKLNPIGDGRVPSSKSFIGRSLLVTVGAERSSVLLAFPIYIKNAFNFTKNGKRFTFTSLAPYQVYEEEKNLREKVRMFEHEKKEKSLMKVKGCEDTQLSKPSQGVAKVEPLTPSSFEEVPKVKSFHMILEIEEGLETHVENEISNEDSCVNMNEKSIEKEEYIETKKRKNGRKREISREIMYL
ncbi:hypothetical protein M9H77_30275 [Catharanthus roseus]|uniref:Uncharacterized protein n=1 Tax=Catharanthus roseus TaxID=4058 RepID=A0ACB9ZZ28_CATRO|nr:hypothetical protein M9H77_30275 [Catharanthus roseus]